MKFGVLSFALCVTILYAEDMIPENEGKFLDSFLSNTRTGE